MSKITFPITTAVDLEFKKSPLFMFESIYEIHASIYVNHISKPE